MMIKFETSSASSIQAPVNFRAMKAEPTPEAKTETTVNSLDNPMDTVGRSQVNFKGARQMLSPKELNMIAKMASELKLDGHEIKVAKQALVDTMNQYNCKSLKQFMKPLNESLDRAFKISEQYLDEEETIAEDMLSSFADNVLRIDPEANADRITSIIDDLIAGR